MRSGFAFDGATPRAACGKRALQEVPAETHTTTRPTSMTTAEEVEEVRHDTQEWRE